MRRFLAGALLVVLLLLTIVPAASANFLEDFMIYGAIDALCRYWNTELYGEELGDRYNGYLEVKNTRVIYLCDPLPEDDTFEEIFGDTVCLVEFMLLSDFWGGAPVYENFHTCDTVKVKKDGTFEVCMANPLWMFISRTYCYDFTGIVESISDRGSKFNGRYGPSDCEQFPDRDKVQGEIPELPEETALIQQAEELFLQSMTEKHYSGYGPEKIEIKNTRVIYFQETMPNETAEELLGELKYYVEFMILSNYYRAKILLPDDSFVWVVMRKDGTWEALEHDPLQQYMMRTYDTNLETIVEYISDRGTKFNRSYIAGE